MKEYYIERAIRKREDFLGDYFVFMPTRTKYYTLEMARDARRHYDWNKKKWNTIGCHKKLLNPQKSTIEKDPATKKWYVAKKTEDDILVTDPVRNKADAIKIKEYLDREGWTLSNLNILKFKGLDNLRKTDKYSNILPLKEGYVIIDKNKKIYNKPCSLQEAVDLKYRLLQEGLLL